ncbi:MAG: hypothetical protein HQ475_05650 [SAR202 cluster bacterium]|nr:hypothetical protein [SAR202 cluster bacterium]
MKLLEGRYSTRTNSSTTVVVLALFLALILAACEAGTSIPATSTATPDPTLTPLPTQPSNPTDSPAQLLEDINAAMASLESFHLDGEMVLKATGDDDANLLSVQVIGAGNVKGDNQISLIMDIDVAEFTGTLTFNAREVESVSYIQDPITAEWAIDQDASDSEDSSFKQLVPEGMVASEAELVYLDGLPAYRLTGTVLDDPEKERVVLWVGVIDLFVRQMQVEGLVPATDYQGLIEQLTGEVFQSLLFRLSRFNETVEVTVPPVAEPIAAGEAPTLIPDPTPEPTPLPTPVPRVSYESPELGFSISYPADWTVTPASNPDGVVEIQSAGGGFPYLSVEELNLDHWVTDGTTIAEYGKRVIELYRDPSQVVTSEGEVVLDDGNKAYKAVITDGGLTWQYAFVFRGTQQFQFRTVSLADDFAQDQQILDELLYGLALGEPPVPELVFGVRSLPDGTIGMAYDYSFCDPEPAPGLFCGGPLAANPVTNNPTGGTPNYTFSHGIGLPFGLTLNFNGVLRGTPAEYTPTGLQRFDVCATDQVGTNVCQQFAMNVNPAPVISTPTPTAPLAVTWSGSHNSSSLGGGGCTYDSSGTLSMSITVSGNSFSGSASANGIQSRWVPGCDFRGYSSSSGSVSGTISGDSWDVTFNFPTDVGTRMYGGTATLGGDTLSGRFLRRDGGGSIDGSFTLTR